MISVFVLNRGYYLQIYCYMEGKRNYNTESMNFDENLKKFIVDEMDGNGYDEVGEGEEIIICGIDGCKAEFSTEQEYNKHYEAFHRYICSVCRKRLLSDHLLTMHVLEEHDHLFKIMSQRQPMYQCYVRTCKRRFDTKEERKQHTIENHLFPENSPIFDSGIEDKCEMDEEVTIKYIIKN